MVKKQKTKKTTIDAGIESSIEPTSRPKKRSFWKILFGLIALLALLAIAAKFGSVEYFTNTIKKEIAETPKVETTPVTEEESVSGFATKILGIKVNEKVGEKGIVELDSKNISSSASVINVSVFIDGAKNGTKIAAVLQQKGSGDRIGPVIKDISLEGTVAYNFAFTKPAGGWPVGDYSIQTEISTGETGEIEFSVVK